MKRLLAIMVTLALICTLGGCKPAAPGSSAQADFVSIKDDITIKLGLHDSFADYEVSIPTEGRIIRREAYLQISDDGKDFYNLTPIFAHLKEGEGQLKESLSPIKKEKYYRISLSITEENRDGSVADSFTIYSEPQYFALTYSDYTKMLEEILPEKLIFSCESTDRLEIGRAAVEYWLGLYGESVPEYCRVSSCAVKSVELRGIGADSFCAYVTYDFSTLGGYFRPTEGDFTLHDPTDNELLEHGADFSDVGRYISIRELGGGSYELFEIAAQTMMFGMAVVDSDGTVRTALTATLVQNGKQGKSVYMDKPDAGYNAFNSVILQQNLGTYIKDPLSEAQLDALPEYILLKASYGNLTYYIYPTDGGLIYFQSGDHVVGRISRDEYDALIAIIEKGEAA